MNSDYSFYIPRIHRSSGETFVQIAFRVNGIGDVRRVDFVPIDGNEHFQQAFVHMDTIYDTPIGVDCIRNVFQDNSSIRIYPYVVHPQKFWILTKNHKPVTETNMNIHQLAESLSKLHETVAEQDKVIKDLQAQLQSFQLERLNSIRRTLEEDFTLEDGEAFTPPHTPPHTPPLLSIQEITDVFEDFMEIDDDDDNDNVAAIVSDDENED